MPVILDPVLKSDIAEVRRLIENLVDSSPPLIKKIISGLLGGDGKMLRPMFVIIAGRYGSFEGERIYPLAAAVELLHNATLVHDDIIDDSELRRGSPSVHRMHGSKLAVLAGDYLFSSCFVVASDYSRMEYRDRLAHIVARICEGEIIQDSLKYSLDMSIRNYKRRIAGKTALLFAMSLYIGAREAECTEEDSMLFIRIGYNIGMAFQIIDDILDLTGKTDRTGKASLANDIREGVFNLPVIYAVKKGSPVIRKLLEKPPYSPRKLKNITRLINESGAVEQSRAEAEQYSQRALREINRLAPGFTRDQLIILTEKLLGRDY